jgi:hypothetical protein
MQQQQQQQQEQQQQQQQQPQQQQPVSDGETVTKSNKLKSSPLINMLLLGLMVCCVLSVSANLLHHDTFVHHAPDTAIARAMADFKRGRLYMDRNQKMIRKKKESIQQQIDVLEEVEEELIQNQVEVPRKEPQGDDVAIVDVNAIRNVESAPVSTLGGLNCDAYGGPSEEDAQDMVYWHDIPSDARFISPLKAKRGQKRQYLTFEPDGGMYIYIDCLTVDGCYMYTFVCATVTTFLTITHPTN